MSPEEFDRTLTELLHREPFQSFVVELRNGDRIDIDRPNAVATRSGSALYAPTLKYVRFESAEVKRFIDSAALMHGLQLG